MTLAWVRWFFHSQTHSEFLQWMFSSWSVAALLASFIWTQLVFCDLLLWCPELEEDHLQHLHTRWWGTLQDSADPLASISSINSWCLFDLNEVSSFVFWDLSVTEASGSLQKNISLTLFYMNSKSASAGNFWHTLILHVWSLMHPDTLHQRTEITGETKSCETCERWMPWSLLAGLLQLCVCVCVCRVLRRWMKAAILIYVQLQIWAERKRASSQNKA